MMTVNNPFDCNQIYIHPFLSVCLPEVETPQENIRKKTTWEQKSTKTKAENKHWTGPLTTPSRSYTEEKKYKDFSPPLFHPVSETSRFWQIIEKKS